ncbi:MAG: hypothetical protein RIQ93_3315 [Verrucomicrobiota bacterium]|jgi:tetratricopeptide (TPR) repeat protein
MTYITTLRVLSVLGAALFLPFGLPVGPSPAGAAGPSPDQFDAMRRSMAWQIVLVPHAGSGKAEEQIVKTQGAVRSALDPRAQLERLGWLYVAQARTSNDAGYYKLAEQCAVALQVHDAENAGAFLLRGHVAQSLHRFREAETIARKLVAQREFAFDHGLLGDALVDQGKLDEGIAAYQRMVDLRPELQSFSRVAQARWLKGDLSGAIAAAKLAVSAASPQNPESSAWAFTRLATFQAQAGETAGAEAACARAQELALDYPAALLLQGRLLLAAGNAVKAAELLGRAVAKNPLPEYRWAHADALRSAGRTSQAEGVEAELRRHGAAEDPRTVALFLATRGQQVETAVRLAEGELKERRDVFTHDACAWAQTAAGDHVAAWASMQRALAEGTQDARLFMHAAVITARLKREDAPSWMGRARPLERLLLPSEREHLDRADKKAPPPLAASGSPANPR